ncbi:hypothetical protein C5167_045130 [Papaver somniferum]|uniref:Uncharacterized protein n=1 Tax=Papaver somniferum TaxID=3469 RepID=A0A4Y7L9Y7_PAPSO|nr:hypothetical protein C5167_045130 [Papaver somniferum]
MQLMLTAINSRSAECLAVKRKKCRMRIWKKDANSPSYPPFLLFFLLFKQSPSPNIHYIKNLSSQQHEFPLVITLSCFDSAGGFQTTTFPESLYSAVPVHLHQLLPGLVVLKMIFSIAQNSLNLMERMILE